MAVKQATRDGSTSSIMQESNDGLNKDSVDATNDGGFTDDSSLHRYLIDSTTHRRHSVIGALEFREPVSTDDRIKKWSRTAINDARRKTWYQWLRIFLPCLQTFEGYQMKDLPVDLISGFTVCKKLLTIMLHS
jgi:hypothetical protein